MKCPLIMEPENVNKDRMGGAQADCLRSGCAWWISDISMCSIRDLALELQHTQHRLQDLKEGRK